MYYIRNTLKLHFDSHLILTRSWSYGSDSNVDSYDGTYWLLFLCFIQFKFGPEMNSSELLLLNVGSRRPKIHYNALCVWCCCYILLIFHMIFQFHFIVLIFVILFLCRVHVANSHMYLNTHNQFVLNHKTVNFFTSVANDGNKFCGLWLRSLPININETDISKQYMRRRSVHTLRNRFYGCSVYSIQIAAHNTFVMLSECRAPSLRDFLQ